MLIPSIDLLNGKVVQLRAGKEKLLELDDWRPLVEEWKRISEIALIDLDQAIGSGSNRKIVEEIIPTCRARVGGGIRAVEEAEKLIRLGAEKVILSSAIFKAGEIDLDFVLKLVQQVPASRVIIALDVLDDEIMINGWRKKSGVKLEDGLQVLKRFSTGFLVTFVQNEGSQQGLPLETVRQVREMVDGYLVVAGGTATMDEVIYCDRLGVDVQVGMAIYQKKIDPLETFIAILNWKEGLLPVVVEDRNGQLLSLVYCNQESLRRSLQSGECWYFSRSRGKLWQKGENSGNFQQLIFVQTDCDRDALLFVVDPAGPACHRQTYSCFGEGRKNYSLFDLQNVIRQRLIDKPVGSYSASLSEEERAKKLLEECLEVILAQNSDQLVWEAADLLYFLLLKLTASGIDLSRVFKELERRSK